MFNKGIRWYFYMLCNLMYCDMMSCYVEQLNQQSTLKNNDEKRLIVWCLWEIEM